MAKSTKQNELEQGGANKPVLKAITKTYEEELGPYHTIQIQKGKKDPKYLPVNVIGTLKDGRPIHFRWLIQRGVKVPNVPDCALKVLENALEKNYTFEMKDTNKLADGESAHIVHTTQDLSYPFSVHETYPTRKPEPGPKVVNNNG